MELRQIQLSAPSGLILDVINYGATLTRLRVPDKNGVLTDVVVGMPLASDYLDRIYQRYNIYLGSTVGRYAGRISGGGFTINNQFFPITNKEGIQLHGGDNAIDKQFWQVETIDRGDNPYVLFSLESPAGDNGFPGTVKLYAKYQLTGAALQITYTATTDEPTVVNLTNHVYFNLDGGGTVLGNKLYVNASHVLELDDRLVPTGRFLKIHGTPFDYTIPSRLHFNVPHGLDTPFVLEEGDQKATLFSASSGIQMNVYTNQPAMILYTPTDFGDLEISGKEKFGSYPAICFECQNFPDAPNQKNFPSTLLKPGEEYLNEMRYEFSCP